MSLVARVLSFRSGKTNCAGHTYEQPNVKASFHIDVMH